MPVSTRSHSQINRKRRSNEEEGEEIQANNVNNNVPMRNLHHGLKEKLRALTLLYEQQKKASAVLRNNNNNNNNNNVLEENTMPTTLAPMANSIVFDDSKENLFIGTDHKILGVSSLATKGTKTAVARKLSMEMDEKNESRILVFVRLRPMSKKEKEAGSRCCVKIVNKKDVYLTEFGNEIDYLRLKRLKGRHFTFDASFPDFSTQCEVYTTTTADLVEAVLQGRNGSVFCYGATGAGKTYTMLGTIDNPGVMVLAIKDLFAKIRQRSFDGNHVVHLSYLEVYNETVRDLLSPGRPLVLREDKQGIAAAGLTQYRAYSTDEVMALLQRGNQNRTTEPTRANETSSRSHAILQVVVEYRLKDASMNVINRVGKLSLIDLAGSERALATDQRTLRSLEGANINRSLLALSSCINALVERKKHIPYRNSKLTQLLKDSLGGACNTVMIANISPSNVSFGETQNTLHWADRAKEIRTKTCEANEDVLELPETRATDQTKLVLKLQKENRELRSQLVRQQKKLLSFQAQSMAAKADISPPTPASLTSLMTPPSSAQPDEKTKLKPSISARNCFTPESRKRVAEEAVKELKLRVKALESEMVRMKKDHALELKQKDDTIQKLLRKNEKTFGELKSPSHRFRSPVTSKAKKRSFYDISTANSPSITTLNGRKTRRQTTSQPFGAPSLLLQPGFARQGPDVRRK